MSITDPSDIADLHHYHDTADTDSITDAGGKVSDFDDKTVNDVDYYQTNTDKQPITNSTLKNGKNVLEFDGGQLLRTSQFTTIEQPYTKFVFVKFSGLGSVEFVTDGSAGYRSCIYKTSSDKLGLHGGDYAETSTTIDTEWHLIIATFDGSSSNIYVDNVLDTPLAPSPGTDDVRESRLGARYASTGFFDGLAGDSGLYTRILTTNERSDLDTYIREKYGELVPRTVPNPACVAGDAENTLTWDEANGFMTYDLYWSTSTPVTTGDTRIAGITSGYSHTGRSNGTEYYYCIVAQNDAGESLLSTEVSGTPAGAGSPPAAPTNPLCVIGNTQNTISWDAPADTDSYKLYWKLSTPVTTGDNEIVLGDVLSYVHTGRTNGTDYFYAVLAVNEHGDGDLSTEVSGIPIAPPANLAAVPGSASQENDISWDASTGATSYNLYFKTTPGVTTGDTELTGVTSPYTHTGITNDQIYYYRVEAVNPDGVSDLSNEEDATPFGIPTAPGGVVATSGDTQNLISFNNSVSATSYNIYHKLTSPVTVSDTKITGVTSPHAHTGLTNGVEVFYIVTAENVRGESVASSEVSGIPAEPPPLPENNDNNITILAAQYLLKG